MTQRASNLFERVITLSKRLLALSRESLRNPSRKPEPGSWGNIYGHKPHRHSYVYSDTNNILISLTSFSNTTKTRVFAQNFSLLFFFTQDGFSGYHRLHTLRQIIQKTEEYNRPLYLAFVDYEKAFRFDRNMCGS